jgi:hypothetical protein
MSAMSPNTIEASPDLQTITRMIERSAIVVAVPAQAVTRLPAGFDQVDIAVLRWIALESRRAALARH